MIRHPIAAAALLLAPAVAAQTFRPGEPVRDINPYPVKITASSAGSSTGQVTAGTTAVPLVAARPGRTRVGFKVGAANTCAFGFTSGVTLTTGYPLEPIAGASASWETGAALWVVCSATTTVSYVDQ